MADKTSGTSRKAGFTLVELLVVIAIIALLMSILMPALARVRDQAKDVLGRSNLKQWTLIFSMYTEDFDGSFPQGFDGSRDITWPGVIEPYCKDPKICLCPTATKPWGKGGRGTFAAWDDSDAWLKWSGVPEGWSGSYGLNEWLYNPPEDLEFLWDSPTEFNWRHINVREASKVPMLLDCWWIGGGPTHKDEPPEYDGQIVDEGNFNDIKRFCLNRHNKAVNGCFLDLSVRRIPLKCLWRFKWSRDYDLGYPLPVAWDAPGHWMKNMTGDCP
jgi:prepilin-type N-terminal cleavage/methylation domain-containing protein